MDAFLLAAGFGTRLRPFTETTPKPLLEVTGTPLLSWNLSHLSRIVSGKIIINTHYLNTQIEEYIKSNRDQWNIPIELIHEPELLDTGGGLKNAWSRFTSEFITSWNSDIIIHPSFSERSHPENFGYGFSELESLARDSTKMPDISILVREDTPENLDAYGKLGISKEGRLVSFLGQKFRNEPINKFVMFAGITIMSKRIERFFPADKNIFSYTRDLFPEVLRGTSDSLSGGIWALPCACYWSDVGTIQRLEAASKQMKEILRLQGI